jgi:hypothetical protein
MYQEAGGKRTRISEDRTEDLIRMMDECVHTHIETCQPGVCGISDICTKRDELIQPRIIANCAYCKKDITEGEFYARIEGIPYHEKCNTDRKSAILDMALTQTLPEDVMKKQIMIGIEESITKVKINTGETMENRMRVAIEQAEMAFWDVIARAFPEAVSGDYLMDNISETLLPNVKHWLELNMPAVQTPCWRGDLFMLNELNLNYRDTWHLAHTGGGCMVAVTDNVAVACKHYYLAVSNDCVCIYEDVFTEGTFLMEHVRSWEYGENPCVLMNHIDELMGGTGYWDTGKLFDDIMTIGKSDKL